ncbi:hypothetical protein PR048_033541 [Dryococelus australis]|uniref:Uncharacterized protein n=1 Tax=Dryococelus australis TaxID=614101 RepID=A0ABQ9G0K3_9NEOP|nr:hypothetical protein PR048_033541 [Dryococelus australis]
MLRGKRNDDKGFGLDTLFGRASAAENECIPTSYERHDGNTARLARRSDEALEVRVSVARIALSLLDLGRGISTFCIDACRELSYYLSKKLKLRAVVVESDVISLVYSGRSVTWFPFLKAAQILFSHLNFTLQANDKNSACWFRASVSSLSLLHLSTSNVENKSRWAGFLMGMVHKNRWGKREIPKKTRQPATSSDKIPTWENPESPGWGLKAVRLGYVYMNGDVGKLTPGAVYAATPDSLASTDYSLLNGVTEPLEPYTDAGSLPGGMPTDPHTPGTDSGIPLDQLKQMLSSQLEYYFSRLKATCAILEFLNEPTQNHNSGSKQYTANPPVLLAVSHDYVLIVVSYKVVMRSNLTLHGNPSGQGTEIEVKLLKYLLA